MKPGVNQGGPPPKAKYSQTTDSEEVRRLKNEKHPVEGSEIEPETIYLQAVGAQYYILERGRRDMLCTCVCIVWDIRSVTACLLHNDPASYRMRQG